MPLGETARLAVQLNLTGNFNREGTKAIGTIKGMATQTKSLQSQVKSSILTGVGLGAGVTGFALLANGINSVIDFGSDAVGMASDLAESQSKVNVVFAEGAREIHDWASTASTAMGLTEQAALEAAGTFGNFIQALGNSREEAQSMSMDIVKLAADLASFNNTDINEVIIALRSGLAGEAEPMRRLGVSISATRVEANILAKGIARTKEEITDAMKVSERYAIIMQDTALAQGDFARTSDGLANSQRILTAQMAELQTAFGTMLLPHLTNAVNLFQDLVDIIDGPDGVSKAMDTYIDRQRELKGLTDETTQATKEWVSGLGSLEDSFADTIAGDFAPHMREAVLLWREFGEELSRNGDSFNEWESAFFKAKNELGLTSDAALQLTLDLVHQGRAVEAAISSARLWGTHMRGTALAVASVGDEVDETRVATRKLTVSMFDASAASEAAEGGYRKQRRELNRLINAAENFRAKNERVLPRAIELIGQAEEAQRQQTQAANRGLPTQVAKWQAVQDSIQGMLSPLRAALALTVKLQAQSILQPGFDAVARLIGGGGTGKTERRAVGGPVQAWHTYQVNENTPEYLTMGGRGGWISPRGPMGNDRADTLNVRVQPIITAFQVGRELGRAATTRRSGAGVL